MNFFKRILNYLLNYRILNTYKTIVYVEEVCIDEIKGDPSGNSLSYVGYKEEEEHNIDLLIVIGGDGSILWALQYFHHRVSPPILAFSKVKRNMVYSKDYLGNC